MVDIHDSGLSEENLKKCCEELKTITDSRGNRLKIRPGQVYMPREYTMSLGTLVSKPEGGGVSLTCTSHPMTLTVGTGAGGGGGTGATTITGVRIWGEPAHWKDPLECKIQELESQVAFLQSAVQELIKRLDGQEKTV